MVSGGKLHMLRIPGVVNINTMKAKANKAVSKRESQQMRVGTDHFLSLCLQTLNHVFIRDFMMVALIATLGNKKFT
jgi:hypothetical protein